MKAKFRDRLIVVLVLMVFSAVAYNSINDIRAKGDDKGSQIIYNSDEYMTFTFPESYSIEIDLDSERSTDVFVAEHYITEDSSTWKLKPEYGTKYELSDNYGLMYFTANKEQAANMFEVNKRLLEGFSKKLIEVDEIKDAEWAEDYSSLKVYIDKETVTQGIMFDYARLSIMCYAARQFYSYDNTETIHVTYYNAESKNMYYSHLFPYERVTFNNEDWKKSESEDVTECSSYSDGVFISGTYDSMSDPYVHFIPDDTSIFEEYAQDGQPINELYLQYEDVFLQYGVEKGDRFDIRIDLPTGRTNENYIIIDKTTLMAPEGIYDK